MHRQPGVSGINVLMRRFFQKQKEACGRHIPQRTGRCQDFRFAVANIAFLLVEWNGHKDCYCLPALLVLGRQRLIDSALRVIAVNIVVRDTASEEQQQHACPVHSGRFGFRPADSTSFCGKA